MKIAVLGTGNVGQTFVEKLISLGHQVMIGTRNVSETVGREAFKEWHDKHPLALVGTFDDAVKFGELVVNATKGEAGLSIFSGLNKTFLGDKIIVDVSNPLDFSKGFPPTLIDGLHNTSSLGEELQKLVPNAKVVKTLNTMWCGLMVNPMLINDGNHINYLCGNDAEAKTKVMLLLNGFGWKNESLLDLGDISNARGTEAVLPIWVRIFGATQNGVFNFALVK
jgi:8-hydroxy-5-deazaflavin:NADPH oxidoreductase